VHESAETKLSDNKPLQRQEIVRLIAAAPAIESHIEGTTKTSCQLRFQGISVETLNCRLLLGVNLSNADLSYLDLRGANFSYSNLTGANLSHANLSECNFSRANLSGACLNVS
jgi:uncharacterized protein YjbI with pentapeptide repeats